VPTPRRAQKRSLLRRCHQGSLEGGLSISLRATPDEAVGPLLHALGAKGFKLLDVRTGAPMVLEIAWNEVHEKWELADLEALVHNLNDLFRDTGLPVIAVLGEWEDMLQLWCVPRADLPAQLASRALDEARNVRALWGIAEGVSPDP
jgi:hypothetical protein